jgi:hypothetical protein
MGDRGMVTTAGKTALRSAVLEEIERNLAVASPDDRNVSLALSFE